MKYFAIFAAVLGVAMALPAPSVWTLDQLSDALDNPHTDSSLRPYLEEALNKLIASIFAGSNVNAIVVDFPEVNPSPVIPEFVPTPSANSGPLVQLIVNINQKNEVVASPVEIAESPEFEDIAVGPVIVDENPEIAEHEDIAVGPVIVDENPEVAEHEDIAVGPVIIDENPEVAEHEDIAVGPVIVDENPEVAEHEDIAVGPVIIDENPEIISNPVDIMNPIPAPVIDGDYGVIV